MRNKKVKIVVIILFVIIAATILSVSVIAMVSNNNLSRSILDIFKQKQSDNPSVLSDYKNLETFASVNGLPIPKNIVILKKAMYEARLEHSKNINEPPSDSLGIISCPSEEEIVQDIAKRLLFVEYAKKQGIIVKESEINSYFNEMRENHKLRLQENNSEAILKAQLDKEFSETIGLSQEEIEENILYEQIVYSLYCEKFARSMSHTESNDWKGFDSLCNDLLAKAEIVYYE